MDTLGVLLVVVGCAQTQDRDGATMVFLRAERRFSRLRLVWPDGGYRGRLVRWTAATCGWVLRIVKRSEAQRTFVVLPKRWIVERTFGWLNKWRRLSKDYERLPQTSGAAISQPPLPAPIAHLLYSLKHTLLLRFALALTALLTTALGCAVLTRTDNVLLLTADDLSFILAGLLIALVCTASRYPAAPMRDRSRL